MKSIFLITTVVVLITACQSNSSSQQTNVTLPGIHKVVVEEVIQTSSYTYLRVKEEGNEQWLALPKMQASAGEVYYYKVGLLMKEFVSKELNRTFKEVLFLDQISKTPEFPSKEVPVASPHNESDPHGSMPVTESKTIAGKKEIKMDPAKGGITIAELYRNKSTYSGNTVKIKGQVTKFNAEIMNKNWVHIQDGTENEGNFDLTITTQVKVKVGDMVTFEGVIALERDFGHGYFYEVIMEEAKLVK